MKIEGFVSQFSNQLTRLGYRSSIHQFLEFKYGFVRKKKDASEEDKRIYEELADKYLSSGIPLLKDLRDFKDWQFNKKRPPHSISQNIAYVRIWAEHYGHDLTAKELRELRRHTPRFRTPVSREDEITHDLMRKILSHANARTRAMILVMISSGIRIGELSQLTEGDIDLDKNTIYISDIIAKSREARVTFFTDEAKDALKIYLKNRPAYVDRAQLILYTCKYRVYTMASKEPVENGKRVLLFLDGRSLEILNAVQNKSAFTREAILLKAQHEGIAA